MIVAEAAVDAVIGDKQVVDGRHQRPRRPSELDALCGPAPCASATSEMIEYPGNDRARDCRNKGMTTSASSSLASASESLQR